LQSTFQVRVLCEHYSGISGFTTENRFEIEQED
jgi:hypothetical protein